jgi:hypothetical protein
VLINVQFRKLCENERDQLQRATASNEIGSEHEGFLEIAEDHLKVLSQHTLGETINPSQHVSILTNLVEIRVGRLKYKFRTLQLHSVDHYA